MNHYVVTGFNEQYWNFWGLSWIASLKELAKFSDTILVVDFGLSPTTKKRIVDFGAYLLPGRDGNFRKSILQATAEFAAKYSGVFAVWDADVYFQQPIDEIFDLAKQQVVITDNPGFYAGRHSDLVSLNETQNAIAFFQGDVFVYDCLKQFFPSRYSKVSATWNFTDVTNIPELDKQKVIHPQGVIKSLLPHRKILFWERHKELFGKYAVKHTSVRKLVKKASSASESISIQHNV